MIIDSSSYSGIHLSWNFERPIALRPPSEAFRFNINFLQHNAQQRSPLLFKMMPQISPRNIETQTRKRNELEQPKKTTQMETKRELRHRV